MMSMPDENVLQINVAETIKTGDTMGTFQNEETTVEPQAVEDAKKLSMEEYMAHIVKIQERYVEPHNKKSRWVTPADIPRVLSEGKLLLELCNLPRGSYRSIAALAHSQIDDQDPLRFFVLPNGMVVINPVITGHTKVPVFKSEGCMTFPNEPMKTMVPRYNKVEVTFQLLAKKEGQEDPELSEPTSDTLNTNGAHIFQHEIAHLNGHQVYDEDYDPNHSVGLGNGIDLPWKAIEESELAALTK